MPDSPSKQSAAIRALLVSDLVGSTRLVENLGDSRAAKVMDRHDKVARSLMQLHHGIEIDKTDGFLILFERPVNAVFYSIDYHEALEKLAAESGVPLEARVGIHLGEVILRENPQEHVARGAKPLEVEGLAKPTAARLMSLAEGGQTLLTRTAYDVALRSMVGSTTVAARPIRWAEHGAYAFKGVSEPIDVFEVGIEGKAPLRPPTDSEKVSRVAVEAAIAARVAAKSAADSAAEARIHEERARRGGSGAGRWIGLVVVIAALAGAAWAVSQGLLDLSGPGPADDPAPAVEPEPLEPRLVADWQTVIGQQLDRHRRCASVGGRDDCMQSTARALIALYGLPGLEIEGTPFSDEQLQERLRAGGAWRDLGSVGDQAVIDRGVEAVAAGQPVVAVGGETVHASILLPGELVASGSWGVRLPPAASFFHWNPAESFVDRPLSYAYRSPVGVRLYVYTPEP